MVHPGALHIGTSGWHYAHWKGTFYPDGLRPAQQLGYYAARLRSVEVNNSFYRLPEAETFAAWRSAVPEGFVFAVKGSRYITHLKKLKDPQEPLGRLYGRVERLGDKLGPILFQLPPRWRFDADRFEAFLAALSADHRHAFEFRDPSWFAPRATDALTRRGAAFCIYDLAGMASPHEVTADFVYVRLHGPGAAYQGRYAPETLRAWAGTISAWRHEGRDVCCYFDNDEAGHAAHNALELSALAQ
ncbi:MAG TPA: DUF72 domain-containing protein [Rubricoccaceae bacterium]|nr:DUF72 domain-containing protein [Rubricoccaceae bacterium]